jgi:hypothetical protein
MILKRLEEEVARASWRLDHVLSTSQAGDKDSPDGGRVADLARKELLDLQRRLELVDRVLSSVVEQHPNLFDASDAKSEHASVPPSLMAGCARCHGVHDLRAAGRGYDELQDRIGRAAGSSPRPAEKPRANDESQRARMSSLNNQFVRSVLDLRSITDSLEERPHAGVQRAVDKARRAEERAAVAQRLCIEGDISISQFEVEVQTFSQAASLAHLENALREAERRSAGKQGEDAERRPSPKDAERRSAVREAAVKSQRETRANLMRGTITLDELEDILTKRPDATARRAVDRAQAARKRAESAGKLYTNGDLSRDQLEADMTEFLQAVERAKAAVDAAPGTARRPAEEQGQDAERPPSPPDDGQSHQGAGPGGQSYFDFMMSSKY